MVIRKTLDKTFHVESIQLAVVLLLLRWPSQILSICVEKAGQASHKCGSDTIGVESFWADNRNEAQTPAV